MVLGFKAGWAFGVNLTTGMDGMFPMAVTENSNKGSMLGARAHSLIATFKN
jgi:hypothetical protein